MSKLQSKTALVTGASKGIGAGIAKELGASGAAVVVNYATDRSGAEAVVTTITIAGGAIFQMFNYGSLDKKIVSGGGQIQAASGANNLLVSTVVMNADSKQARADQTRVLFNWGYGNFEEATPAQPAKTDWPIRWNSRSSERPCSTWR